MHSDQQPTGALYPSLRLFTAEWVRGPASMSERVRMHYSGQRDWLSWGAVEWKDMYEPHSSSPARLVPVIGGLMAERVFGPIADFYCYCGMTFSYRNRGVTCRYCGVQVTKASVRSERWGHIELAAPVPHPLFTHVAPAWLRSLLGDSSDIIGGTLFGSCLPELRDPATAPRVTCALERKLETLTETEARSVLGALSASEREYVLTALGEARRTNSQLPINESPLSAQLNGVVMLRAIPIVPAGLRPTLPGNSGPLAAKRLNALYVALLDANARLFDIIAANATPDAMAEAYPALQSACDALLLDPDVERLLMPRFQENADAFIESQLLPSLLSASSSGDDSREAAAMEAFLALGHLGTAAAAVAQIALARVAHADSAALGTFGNQRQWVPDALSALSTAAIDASEGVVEAALAAWYWMPETNPQADEELLNAAERVPVRSPAVSWKGVAALLGVRGSDLSPLEGRLISLARSESHDAQVAASTLLEMISVEDCDRVRVGLSLLNGLSALSVDQRFGAVTTAANIGASHESIARLLEDSLRDSAPTIRAAAAMGLSRTQLDHVTTGRILARAFLIEGESSVSAQMILALAQVATPDREVLHALNVAAVHPDASVRAAVAAFPHRELRSSQLEKLMFALLKDPESSVANAAADAIATRTLLSDDGVRRLRDMVKSTEDERASMAAARALGRFASRRAQAMWGAREAMRDLRHTVRAAVAQGVGESTLITDELETRLIAMLSDGSSTVRLSATVALAQYPLSRDAILSLADRLEDEDEAVRSAANEGLFTSESDLSALLTRGWALVRSARSWHLSSWALSKQRMKLAEAGDTQSARLARSQLDDLSQDLVPILASALYGGIIDDEAILSELGALGTHAAAAVPLLEQMLDDSRLALSAALALASIGSTSGRVRRVLSNACSSALTVSERLVFVVALAKCGEPVARHLRLLGFVLVEPWLQWNRLGVLDALRGLGSLSTLVADDVIGCLADHIVHSSEPEEMRVVLDSDKVQMRLVDLISMMGLAATSALPALDALAGGNGEASLRKAAAKAATRLRGLANPGSRRTRDSHAP